ncbi:DNA polymerase III subunit delta [Wenxinia marina]|uniref:DNA-directed DNA polymerase n=1 Tax=Wenxinia marina DSM 24838 TaxID=1123501 RepID=A0A0D0PG99_9RHOB|nr:hypothetical protein [Wenxinia marina]KIQ70376.1 DNA polymerase III, delta subunit [Wenxinia marina DSM 24838]GGL53660.1 DNA polymerase III subunit delta [Wenxinia marina]
MKLSGRDVAGFFRAPPSPLPAVLIHGEDAMRVALKRQELILKLIGPEGEGEMRLARIPAADLRKDGAALDAAMRAQGFFPGARVVFVEEATDGLAETIGAALADWREGDATVVVTAGQLSAKSALRKMFESDRRAVAIALYDDPPSEGEVMDLCASTGLAPPDGDGRAALMALSRDLSPGDFRQTVEKLGLYLHGEGRGPTAADVAVMAPQSHEADLDDLIAAVADGGRERIAEVLRRLYAQGVQPVGLCIAAQRHFRRLHAAASDPGGPAQGAGRLRPPVFGPRRDRLVRQAEAWGRPALERALDVLVETDLALRSAGQTAPAAALTERALIRLAMMAKGRG